MNKVIRTLIITPFLLTFGAVTLYGQTSTTPATLTTYSTIRSIGIEWAIVGDSNHNASVSVAYSVEGTGGWSDALPLVRVDNANANMLAGSILFLTPATTYNVRLTLMDPDGGAAMQILSIATRAQPALPTTGRMLHAVPGTGGGDGSAANPFQGIADAQAAASPGDIVLLHHGS